MASHHYPAHPPTGGKGLPPPSHLRTAPQLAATAGSALYGANAAPDPTSHIRGTPPDLEKRFKLKVRYLRIQKKYFRSLEVRKDLELELAEKEAKEQKLQDEIDLIIDQIHQSDYAHLRPKDDNLFSDDDEGEVERDAENEEERDEALEVEERERRQQLEQERGVDSNEATIDPSSLKRPSRRATTAVETQPRPTSTATSAGVGSGPAPPKRIKLTFGSGAPNISVQ